MPGEDRHFPIAGQENSMATPDRLDILILFASFLIGSAAGWWSRVHWGNSLVAVAAALAGTVAGYCIIVAALRAAGHPVG
jgi:hypothetical protein